MGISDNMALYMQNRRRARREAVLQMLGGKWAKRLYRDKEISYLQVAPDVTYCEVE